MQAAVIYDSKTGNTEKAAAYVAEGLRSYEEMESRIFSLDSLDKNYIKNCAVVILGSPTCLASITGKMKVWLESNTRGLSLAGKLGDAFATGRYIHGGSDVAIQTLLSHMLVLGMMVYSGGGSQGEPVIHLGPVALSPRVEDFKETFVTYGKRMAEQALRGLLR